MKRFYKAVSIAEADGGWQVALDGRPVKTQLGAPQIVPSHTLAGALAEEWDSQDDTIERATLNKRDMADYAIDIVAPAREDTIAKLVSFAETDTLCYRADPDEPLWQRQLEVWEPLVTAFEARQGVTLTRVSGIVHRPQSEATLAALRARLDSLDHFTLAPLTAMTSLAASLCIGLSGLEDDADGEALWDAANLEEDWQVEQWGEDPVAAERRAKRRGDFLDALEFARLSRG